MTKEKQIARRMARQQKRLNRMCETHELDQRNAHMRDAHETQAQAECNALVVKQANRIIKLGKRLSGSTNTHERLTATK